MVKVIQVWGHNKALRAGSLAHITVGVSRWRTYTVAHTWYTTTAVAAAGVNLPVQANFLIHARIKLRCSTRTSDEVGFRHETVRRALFPNGKIILGLLLTAATTPTENYNCNHNPNERPVRLVSQLVDLLGKATFVLPAPGKSEEVRLNGQIALRSRAYYLIHILPLV